MPEFHSPTGMHDVLPDQQKYYEKIRRAVKEMADFYRFERITTPVLEDYELFEKGTGTSTDVVQKQMYAVETKNDKFALRPEGTPPIARAYIEHGMKSWPKPVRLWYFEPFFRHEKPQAGRAREFHQFGLEVLGQQSPAIDVQVIQFFYHLLKKLKFDNLMIEINSIGCPSCRARYKEDLVKYLEDHEDELCEDCERRLEDNPLRVLDCKKQQCRTVIQEAPQIVDSLCKECHNHFKQTLEYLDELELPYNLNPYLVRGLDYYTKTVFEIFEKKEEDSLEVEPGALVGGGRYDELVELVGGEETPACGGAAGVERLIASMKEKKVRLPRGSKPKVFFAQLGKLAKGMALKLMEEFRKDNISVASSMGRDSLKAQLKRADALDVDYTLILGQKEAKEGEIIVRDMENGKQKTLKLKGIVRKVKRRVK